MASLVDLINWGRLHRLPLVGNHFLKIGESIGRNAQPCGNTDTFEGSADFQNPQIDRQYTIGSHRCVQNVVSKDGVDWAALYNGHLRFLINAHFSDRFVVTAHHVSLIAQLTKLIDSPRAYFEGSASATVLNELYGPRAGAREGAGHE